MSHPSTSAQRRQRTAGHTSNGRGSLQIDRVFPEPIGRIHMASGAYDARALADVNDMLSALQRSVPPRWDILQAIKAKRVAPMHALSLWRTSKLEEIPLADVLPRLAGEYERWAKRLEVTDAYKAQIKSTFAQLFRLGAEPTVGDLPELLQARRDECQDAGKPVAFNRGKAHVQAFVRATLGDDHALYRQITKVAPLAVDAEPERRAQQPGALAAILLRLPPVHQLIAWSLAVSGMRPKEYFPDPKHERRLAWTTQPDRIHVGRSKTEAGSRDIPLWAAGLPALPERSRDAFEGMWTRRIGSELDIYDLRRSFIVWMEDAHIPRSRRKHYAGHAAGDVTDLYERRELDAWLGEDSVRLDGYAGEVVRRAIMAARSPDISPDMALEEG
jgi:hypothetical protein